MLDVKYKRITRAEIFSSSWLNDIKHDLLEKKIAYGYKVMYRKTRSPKVLAKTMIDKAELQAMLYFM